MLILSVFTMLLFITIGNIFPNNGGYTRNLLFIKPSSDGSPGYFIAIDEIYPSKDNIPVDWVLHGRGNLSIFNNNQSAVWAVESYLNPSNIVKLHTIFIEPQVTISQFTGPFYPSQSYVNNPIMIPYIKARPTQTGPTRFVTLLYPLNNSQALPSIKSNNGVTNIGARDTLFTQSSSNLQNRENFTTDATLMFFRSDATNISSYIFKKGSKFIFQNQSYLLSEKIISLNLEYQSSNISGILWIPSPTKMSIWCPTTPNQVFLNGQSLTISYNPVNGLVTFVASSNGTLLISHNPVKCSPPLPSLPTDKPQPPIIKDAPIKGYGSHPYIFFDESDLIILRNRALNEHPWQDWFIKVENNALSHLDDDISLMAPTSRYVPALNLAFTGVITQNMTFIEKAKSFLYAMDDITDYTSHLHRSAACSYYSLAFDMIYQNLTSIERLAIGEKLGNHTIPLLEKFDYLPRNNHIGIVSSGIGLSGLVLEKEDWVTRAISGLDDYFTTSFAPDGGNYEGYYYASYFLETGLKFFFGLKNLGMKDYFSDYKFQSFINNTIYCFSPLSTVPLFEDSECSPQITEDLLWAAGPLYISAPLLSNYSKWVWDNRRINDGLNYEGNYLYSLGNSYHDGLVTRLCMYTFNITPIAPPLETLIIRKDSGLAFMRSEWNPDALFLSITCKNKADFQYHAHYDENSFEIWAYGAWLATNPGYPGYGYGQYDWVTSTEASNTILINNQGQQRVNGEGFQEYFKSSEMDGLVASANSIYSSPGHFAINSYFSGVLFFIILNLVISLIIITYFRYRTYKTNVFFTPKQSPSRFSTLKSKNLSLKIHLTLVFGLSLGIITSLVSFFLFTNPYVQVYNVGKHEAIMGLIPILEIMLLILAIPLVLLLISLKFKMQNSFLHRIVILSTNLKKPQIPALKDPIKHSYLPQCFYLILFIPIMLLLYVPLVNDVVHHIFTKGGSLIDIQNYIIGTLNHFILLFALTLLLYLPFKIIGLYRGGLSLSKKIDQNPVDSMLMMTASYLLSLTVLILLIFYISLSLFFALHYLGVSFIV